MISFMDAGRGFSMRAAAVVVHENRVLLQRSKRWGFWFLPGGRVEHGEDAGTAIERELQEELGVNANTDRLLWLVEGFYQHAGRAHHELTFCFALSLPENLPLCKHSSVFHGQEEGRTLVFQWHPLTALERIDLYPAFLKDGLLAIPDRVTHIVEREPCIRVEMNLAS
jgi:8-oxo-dGTP pyrophosphatase MutT (NUDIX family)